MGLRVIGVGNTLRGDDGAGPAVARALGERGADALEHAGDGVGLIDRFDGAARVVVVDAMCAGLAPGTVRVFEAGLTPLPAGRFVRSSHRIGVAEGIELARVLGRLPGRITVYGIEGVYFDYRDGLSPAVEDAVCAVIARIGHVLTNSRDAPIGAPEDL